MDHKAYDVKNGIVQIPEGDYQALLEKIEDLEDEAALERALENQEELYPGDVVKALLAGENAVRVFRKYRALSQDALADKVGVSKTTICEIETGRKTGSIDTIKKIAAALTVDIDELV